MTDMSTRIAAAFLLLCIVAVAQDPASPRFEVASVKQAAPNHEISPIMRGGPGTSDPERITWEQVTLTRLLSVLYGIKFDQIPLRTGWGRIVTRSS